MSVKLLSEHYLEFLSLKRGCTGSSEPILVKMPHCWKSHVAAHVFCTSLTGGFFTSLLFAIKCIMLCTKMLLVDSCFIKYDFHQCDILASVDSDEPVQPPLTAIDCK